MDLFRAPRRSGGRNGDHTIDRQRGRRNERGGTVRRRQHAPTRRAATTGRRAGGPPGRSVPAPAARRDPARARRRADQVIAEARQSAARPTRTPKDTRHDRPTADKKLRAKRAVQLRPPQPKAPNPRVRARRTITTRTRRLAERFSAGQPRRRLIATLVVILLVLSAVLVKVGLLQTVDGDGLRSAASAQWTRTRPLPARRGSIFDRNGEELALSVPASTIAVNPKQVTDPVGTGRVFASVLGLRPDRRDALVTAMRAKDKGFVYVARQVDDSVADQVRALDLAGVAVYPEDRRTMPGGDTGRSVIGRTDIDGKGIAGLERQYQNVLGGKPGEETLDVAPGGRTVAGTERTTTKPLDGSDVVLTIDRSIQFATEQALLKRVSTLGAKGAQAIVMIPKTGEIVAMASVHVNDRGVYDVTSGNYSAVNAYEPGSVGKVVTMSGALNEGTVTPDTVFTVPWEMVLTKHGDKLHDSHVHKPEPMTVDQILTESSNLGTVMVSRTMGFEKQYDYMRAFGLGQRTALNFPDENPGILKWWQKWEGTEKFTVAYGQGVASSPIQLISAVNALANGGTYVAPKLVKATIDAGGVERTMPPSATHEVVKPVVAAEMRAMMKDVVCKGTAKDARIDGLSIAGKTGTGFIAQKNGGYTTADGTKAYYASFVGFLPAEDPQVTILVSIDQPPPGSGDRFGGTAAAPVFRDLAPTMIHELDITQPPGTTGCPT
jgi:cell division protein FtsI (penicillin-binding protein 3)